MRMNEVKRRAIELGVLPGKKQKDELILEIQRVEGNTACFHTSDGICAHTACCWMDDCQDHAGAGGR